MKKVLLFAALFVAACGSDDVLNQLPDDEVEVGDQVVVHLPDGEEIPAIVADDNPKPADDTGNEEPSEQYPEGYCEADFWVVNCGEGAALVAYGVGCLKRLEMLMGAERDAVCEDSQP